jgi:hypothetical protein
VFSTTKIDSIKAHKYFSDPAGFKCSHIVYIELGHQFDAPFSQLASAPKVTTATMLFLQYLNPENPTPAALLNLQYPLFGAQIPFTHRILLAGIHV